MSVPANARLGSAGRIGTAAWADPAAVETSFTYKPGSIWLGRSLTQKQAPVGYRDDRHVCLISGTRGGKGTTSIVNNLCAWPGSVVVVDPKGENATITASRRGLGSDHAKGLGQKVCVIDPFKAAHVADDLRAKFNPLDVLDPDREESIDEAGRLADALVVINEESKDPFWDESARLLVKGLLLHVLTSPDYEGRRNLLTVRELITRGDWRTVRILEEMGEEKIASSQALLWEAVRRNEAFYGVLAGIGETFRSMILNSPKQYESVVQVANRNTEFLDSPGMRDCLTSSTFKLSDLKLRKEGLSLYLCLPQRFMSTHYRWLRMMIALIVTEMEMVPGRPVTGAPVLMLLDEFAGLKRMKIIEDGVAQLAGFGVKLFFVLQTLEQLKALYKDNWETFISNSGLKVFFGIEDHFSREYISKLIGDTEMMREVRTSSTGTSDSESMAKGRNWSTTSGSSANKSLGKTGGTSRSKTGGKTGGKSVSTGTSTSGGQNRSFSSSNGGSYSESYARPSAFGLWLRGLFGKGRDTRNDQLSQGTNWSTGETVGTNEGWGRSETLGTSEGWSTSDTAGSSSGWSKSETVGTTQSRTEGGSETYTQTRGTTTSQGVNESIHKRALVNPDEIGRLFTRIDDRRHADYPGLALVLMAGAQPAIVRKVNYYEDPFFFESFDPHPDHDLMAPEHCEILGAPDHFRLLGLLSKSLTAQWIVQAGDRVRQGQPIAEVRGESVDSFREVPIDFVIRAPYDGSIIETRNEEVTSARVMRGELGIPFRRKDGVLTMMAYQRLNKGVVDPYLHLEELTFRYLRITKVVFKFSVISTVVMLGLVWWVDPGWHRWIPLVFAVMFGGLSLWQGVLLLLIPGERVVWRSFEQSQKLREELGNREDVYGWDRELRVS